MIEFTEEDRRAIQEAATALGSLRTDEVGADAVERAQYLAGRLAGLAGRPDDGER